MLSYFWRVRNNYPPYTHPPASFLTLQYQHYSIPRMSRNIVTRISAIPPIQRQSMIQLGVTLAITLFGFLSTMPSEKI